MLTSPTWPEGRGGGSGGDGQGEASKVAFGSQAWVAERITEPPAGRGRDRGGRGGRGRAERGGLPEQAGCAPGGQRAIRARNAGRGWGAGGRKGGARLPAWGPPVLWERRKEGNDGRVHLRFRFRSR